MRENKLSECEDLIMSILLEADHDLTLMEVTEQAKICFSKERKLQTTATFLTRMQKKGCISVYKVGRYNHHHPEVTLKDYRKRKLLELEELLLFKNNKEMADFVRNM